jgi:MFS family permease
MMPQAYGVGLNPMSPTAPAFQLRAVVVPIYLPTLLFSAGESALIPVLPAIASRLGADLSVAGLVASMLVVGILIGDIPGGWIVSRIGERLSMLWSSLLALLGIGISIVAPNPGVLGLGTLAIGLATSVFALARHAFLTTFVPLPNRARALSTLGGMFRAGAVLGPLLTAALMSVTHDPATAFWLTAAFTLGASLVLIFMPDPEKSFGQVRTHLVKVSPQRTLRETAGEEEALDEMRGIFKTITRNFSVLIRVGTAAGLVVALRTGRTVLLPLWAVSIGVSSADTALVLGLASAIDFALFFWSGQVMDRFGRLAAIVPSMLGMAIPLVILAFTHDGPSAAVWFVVTALVMGFGNGLGSGINLTLASDLAPPKNPAPFLGAFRFMTDAFGAAAPLMVSGVIGLATISAAAATLGVLGFVGVGMMLRWVPRYISRS